MTLEEAVNAKLEAIDKASAANKVLWRRADITRDTYNHRCRKLNRDKVFILSITSLVTEESKA
jgi:hypothetical protein